MIYIPRHLSAIFHEALKQFAAVLVTGPRQSGKTTFVRNEVMDAAYLSFDDPLNRDFALTDPEGFLDRFRDKAVVLDEIQYVPEILPYIKIRIDADRRAGQWVLTGSQQFHLMKNASETLAGRIAILDLPPFSLAEISHLDRRLESLLWTGFFPEPCLQPEKRRLWVQSYLQTYLERDVRQLGDIRQFRAFEAFVQLCAAHHAQEFHPSALARDCGVTQPTITSWAKTLEASYLAVLLPPFFKNYGKRIIKAPKFYFSDPSLVCHFTRQPSPEALLAGNMAGALFEGFIIGEVWKAFSTKGVKPAAYFWRSQSGLEVDLILQAQGRLIPVEIKLTATPMPAHVKSIERFKALAGSDASEEGAVVCLTGTIKTLPGQNRAIPWQEFPDWLAERL